MRLYIDKAKNIYANLFRTTIVENLLSETEDLNLMARGRQI